MNEVKVILKLKQRDASTTIKNLEYYSGISHTLN
jgi:hypothetical protein